MFQVAWFGFGLFYAVMALALWRMADKTDTHPNWYALVPILNVILFLRLARKPDWWAILIFLPVVNLIAGAIAAMDLCERFGISKWYGLLTFVSPLNLALYLYLAFQAEPEPRAPHLPQPPLT